MVKDCLEELIEEKML